MIRTDLEEEFQAAKNVRKGLRVVFQLRVSKQPETEDFQFWLPNLFAQEFVDGNGTLEGTRAASSGRVKLLRDLPKVRHISFL